ncbi:etoposide-induced protein 2.4 homolog isoform X2 [Ostrea edulis]|uniref:etoposide-induced protein 2.4 homolog isoform X2 n=1 Tax=Ostrea edulis TaxID=37623 RepID=UPI0020941ECD|nr:etoposide-induced protein 2.4 homolog isoform X2 [Ostrea edulis]
MADSTTEIFNGIIQGFRDSILVFRYDTSDDNSDSDKKKIEPQTTLARRRAEKQKQKGGSEVKENKKDPTVKQRLFQCSLWNGGVFLMSILLFHWALLPCLLLFTELIFAGSENQHVTWLWITSLLSWIFGALWILPLFVISKIVNCMWFQDIADAAYLKSRGRPTPINLSVLVADLLFSLLLQAFFLIQSTLATFLPIPAIGYMVGFIHMSLLYSLYAFEYKWFNMGWEVHKRLAYIESYWPYFFGFGVPLAFLTSMSSSVIISGCIFSILFPLFILSANDANESSQVCHSPLKIFAPVVMMTNILFRQSVKSKSVPTSQHSSPRKQTRITEPTSFR